MTEPPSPLAAALETLSEVRQALAYVPRLFEMGELEYAAEVCEEQRVQLRVLLEQLGLVERADLPTLPLPPTAPPRAVVRMSTSVQAARDRVSPRPLSGPGPLPRANPDIGYADLPLF